jgi:hypothetical protein
MTNSSVCGPCAAVFRRRNLLSVSVTFSRLSLTSARTRYRRCQLRFRRTPGEEDLPELAIAEQCIQLGDRGVNQKQNEDPNLYGRKAVPSEVSRHVLRDPTEGSSGEKVFDELFQEPHQENDRPIYTDFPTPARPSLRPGSSPSWRSNQPE